MSTTRSTARLGALLAAAATTLVTAATSTPADADVICTTRIVANSVGGPFTGGTRIDWRFADTCGKTGVTMKLNGQPVALTGATVVDPAVTTAYTLDAYQGTKKITTSTQYAVGGDVYGYTTTLGVDGQRRIAPVKNPATPAANAARTIGGTLVNALGPFSERELLGQTVEIHLIPATAKLTDAGPWQDLRDEMTCDPVLDNGQPNPACDSPRPWSEVRGAGGRLVPGSTTRIATGVGEEEVISVTGHPSTHQLGHILAHELGHTVLDFATRSTQVTANQAAWNAAVAEEGHDFLGDDDYTRSTPGEYFAEGSAAYFGYEYGFTQRSRDEFTRAWLAANEPELHQVLRAVYLFG
jgi:hypothetical protein